jgi:hypothetical protein
MTLREALSQIPDPRARNRQYPLWGLLALILVAFLSRVDSLRGVERFARANPHLLPHLGLRKPPGHTILTLLLHRLDPEKLQEALLQVFPGADLGEVLVVDGKHLRGSGKGKSPLWSSWTAWGRRGSRGRWWWGTPGTCTRSRRGRWCQKGGVPLRPEGEPGGTAGVGLGGVQGHGGEAASRRDRGGVEPGAGWGGVDLPSLGLPLLAGRDTGLSRARAGGADGAGGGAQGDGGGGLVFRGHAKRAL